MSLLVQPTGTAPVPTQTPESSNLKRQSVSNLSFKADEFVAEKPKKKLGFVPMALVGAVGGGAIGWFKNKGTEVAMKAAGKWAAIGAAALGGLTLLLGLFSKKTNKAQ